MLEIRKMKLWQKNFFVGETLLHKRYHDGSFLRYEFKINLYSATIGRKQIRGALWRRLQCKCSRLLYATSNTSAFSSRRELSRATVKWQCVQYGRSDKCLPLILPTHPSHRRGVARCTSQTFCPLPTVSKTYEPGISTRVRSCNVLFNV